jgi:hypothetical protein
MGIALALLAMACAHRTAPTASADQPPPLTRDEIEAGMATVMPRMRFCPDYPPGSAAPHVEVDVAPSGKVIGVRSLGSVTGTPADSCRLAAIRMHVFRANPGTTFDYVFPL